MDPVIFGKRGKIWEWYGKILEWSRIFSVENWYLSEQRHIHLSKKDRKNLRGFESISGFL
jgi:hypothetical protein